MQKGQHGGEKCIWPAGEDVDGLDKGGGRGEKRNQKSVGSFLLGLGERVRFSLLMKNWNKKMERTGKWCGCSTGRTGGGLCNTVVGRSRERHIGAAEEINLLQTNQGPRTEGCALGTLLSSNSNFRFLLALQEESLSEFLYSLSEFLSLAPITSVRNFPTLGCCFPRQAWG